jgi:NAD(P)-dependent dehydrogenase (short-subunit alcohol dehydrogenase family)
MALKLAAEGSTVVCSDINEQGAQATAARVEELGAKAVVSALDTANEEAVKEALTKTTRDLGRLDVLMNNAGVGGKNWETTTAINLDGVYYGLIHACPIMAGQGGGAIVNTASVAGLGALMRPVEYHDDPTTIEAVSAYVASKHAIVGLVKSTAVTVAAQGIRVNALCPGTIKTAMYDRMTEAEPRLGEMVTMLTPAQRIGTPEEVADVAVWLGSDRSAFVTGQALAVDGGFVAQ